MKNFMYNTMLFFFLTTTTIANEVATQRQTLRHAEDTEHKKAIFICMVATPVTPLKYIVGLINDTHQHTHRHTKWK